MATKGSIEKQKRREKMVELYADRRRELKAKVIDPYLSPAEREGARFALNALPRNSSAVRLRNRCQRTGRARGFIRLCKLSRISFREAASSGQLPGIYKASW